MNPGNRALRLHGIDSHSEARCIAQLTQRACHNRTRRGRMLEHLRDLSRTMRHIMEPFFEYGKCAVGNRDNRAGLGQIAHAHLHAIGDRAIVL